MQTGIFIPPSLYTPNECRNKFRLHADNPYKNSQCSTIETNTSGWFLSGNNSLFEDRKNRHIWNFCVYSWGKTKVMVGGEGGLIFLPNKCWTSWGIFVYFFMTTYSNLKLESCWQISLLSTRQNNKKLLFFWRTVIKSSLIAYEILQYFTFPDSTKIVMAHITKKLTVMTKRVTLIHLLQALFQNMC